VQKEIENWARDFETPMAGQRAAGFQPAEKRWFRTEAEIE